MLWSTSIVGNGNHNFIVIIVIIIYLFLFYVLMFTSYVNARLNS